MVVIAVLVGLACIDGALAGFGERARHGAEEVAGAGEQGGQIAGTGLVLEADCANSERSH